jgi:hypothetical protein
MSSSSIELTDGSTKVAIDQDSFYAKDVMMLLKATCQLMGITYLQISPVSLSCVLTLRSVPKEGASEATSTQRRHHKQSQTSSLGHDSAASSRKRLSLPLLSHLTSSITTSFFSKHKSRHPADDANHLKRQKQGITLFTIQIEGHRKRKMDRVNIRFSRIHGSNNIFKMASGWVAGVMSLDGKIGH